MSVKQPKLEVEDAVFTEGEEEARGLVAQWLKSLVDSTEVESGFAVKLMQCGTGSETKVSNWKYDIEYSPEDFAEDVVGAAVQDVQSHRGIVKYAVRAFVGGRERVQRFRLSVPRTEAEEEDEFGEDSLEEAPNRRGIVHQQMRHTEVLMREHRHGMVLIVRSLEGQLHAKDARIKDLENRLREYQDREEDVASLAWVRKLETERIANEEDRKARGLQMLQSAVPLLLGKVLDPSGGSNPLANLGQVFPPGANEPQIGQDGAAPGPVPPAPDPLTSIHVRQDLLLDSVFEGVTMDHVQQLMQVLPPTVVAALGELHRCCEERRAARQAQQQNQTSPRSRNGFGTQPTQRP